MARGSYDPRCKCRFGIAKWRLKPTTHSGRVDRIILHVTKNESVGVSVGCCAAATLKSVKKRPRLNPNLALVVTTTRYTCGIGFEIND